MIPAAFPLLNLKDAAIRRYTYRIFTAMICYIAAIFTVTWVFNHRHPHGALAYILAIIPAIPTVAVIATFGLYLREVRDEFVRTMAVQSSLWATGITLGFACFWGFIETYAHPPAVPMFWLFVLWWVAFGIMQPVMWRRYR